MLTHTTLVEVDALGYHAGWYAAYRGDRPPTRVPAALPIQLGMDPAAMTDAEHAALAEAYVAAAKRGHRDHRERFPQPVRS